MGVLGHFVLEIEPKRRRQRRKDNEKRAEHQPITAEAVRHGKNARPNERIEKIDGARADGGGHGC